MARHRVLGVNDEAGDCECCGKTGLKKVVWIEDTETGSINHYGCVCATRTEWWSMGHENTMKRAASEMTARGKAKAKIQASKNPAAYAFRAFGWGTKDGWIVDGLNRRVCEV